MILIPWIGKLVDMSLKRSIILRLIMRRNERNV